MKNVLLVSSLSCVVLLLVTIYTEILAPEYQQYQRAYVDRLVELADSDKAREAARGYQFRIRQLVLADLQRTDRCVACHVGIEDPRMEGEDIPLKQHSGRFLELHDVRKFGCTICHDGQGRALTERDAHGDEAESWEKPLLPSQFVYSSCMRCHEDEDIPMAGVVTKGREMFFSRGCMGCHKFKGKGGIIAPDLTNIADASVHLKHSVSLEMKEFIEKLGWDENIAYIYESVKMPHAQPDTSAMMDFSLNDEEVLALAVFLKGLSKKAVPASYLVMIKERRRRETIGGSALYAKYCIACHGSDAAGGVKNINYAKRTVPALNTLAEKMFLEYPEDAEYFAELLEESIDIENMSPPLDLPSARRVIAQYLAIKDVIRNGGPAAKEDPEGPSPPLHMPGWAEGMTDKNIDSIIAYLLSLYPWEEYDDYYDDYEEGDDNEY